MIKKIKITYALIAILIVALVITNVYFYLENNNLSSLVRQEHMRMMWEKAEDVHSCLRSFESFYYLSIQELQSDLNRNLSNETIERLVWRTAHFLMHYSDEVFFDVEHDLWFLSTLDEETPSEVYENVSNTVEYALGQVSWSFLGRGDPNESYTLLWELYYILGVDQITRIENFSGLRGIEYSFSHLSSYWHSEYSFILTNGRQKIPSYYPKPEKALKWALGNATVLYQELTEWHERTKPT